MNNQRRTQVERTTATRTALVAAGRRLFADRGFAGVGTEAIVSAAAVSRGALYHHFADKTELFAAALEEVESEVADELRRAAEAVADQGFRAMLLTAVGAWLDACDEPEVQRIVLLDGPSVLGWPRWREICQRYVLGLIQAVVSQGIAAGQLADRPVVPISHALIAVADEAALYVVASSDRAAARQEMLTVADDLLASLEPPAASG